MLESCIVLLGKEPRPGQVKTRLARDIGPHKAALIQHQLTLTCIQQLSQINTPIILQMSGNINGHFAHLYREYGLVVEAQVDGGLSEKIQHASTRGHRTLILGTDMPLIPIQEIESALTEEHLVIGPSQDGGYWLIGGTQIPQSILEDMPWSTTEVYEKTIAKCEQLGLQYKVLSCQYDIDTATDLSSLIDDPRCPPSLRHSLVDILEDALSPS
jgi:rSAM/selenodomain-associated transferase 1